MSAAEEARRELAAALLAWRDGVHPGTFGEVERRLFDAIQAVVALPLENEPTGFVTRKAWYEIPAGYFVRAPKGTAWYEVIATRAMHSDLQLVTLKAPDGRTVDTQRPQDDVVDCRRGTASGTAEIAEALEVLGPGAHIIEDTL